MISHLAERISEQDEQLRNRLFDMLNDLPLHYKAGTCWNEKRRQSYLNHLRMYGREPVMAWNLFEINRQLPLCIFNYTISFVVMIRSLM